MSEPTTPAPRFTLRQLPLPAKLVLTLFLLTVGLGYTSAMIQLHMQHSDKDGTTLPTPANVVAVFAGKVWKTDDGERVASRLESIISGPSKGGLTGTNMAPAFFDKDEADFRKIAKEHPEKVQQLEAEREGERQAVIAWANAALETRQKAYEEDRFTLPAARAKEPLSDAYRDKGQQGVAKVRSILRDRCVRCHKPGGDKADIPLTTYEELTKFMPAGIAVPEGGGYVDSGRQMSLEKLTQSTHAHLLSFAVLFTLTGLTFAFTSYPGIVRGVVGPVVLLAQVADVSCWWLARLPSGGPYFAMAIIGTGGVVGLGLGAQIVLSLFNMYGPKGKAVLLGLFLLAGGVGGSAYVQVIKPYLDAEKEKAMTKAADDKKKAAAEKNQVAPKTDEIPPKKNGNAGPPVSPTGPSRLEKLMTGPFDTKGPWGGKSDGGMVRAFFDKDEEGEFKAALKDASGNADAPEMQSLKAAREGEQAALLAWVRMASAADRKKAYDDDRFTLPAELAGKPVTPKYKANDSVVKVKLLITDRCVRCHGPDGDQAEHPLNSYEGIEKYLKPGGVAATPPDDPMKPSTAQAAAPAADPIPAAKE